ncbi:MAG: hypothetical protein ACTSPY_10670 [Candidatus Helarchaeota archaeon]
MKIKFTKRAENFITEKVKELKSKNIQEPYAIGIYDNMVRS